MTSLNPEPKQEAPAVSQTSEGQVASQHAETNVAQSQDQATPQKQGEGDQEAHEDPNWRAFREARKRDRIEKEAAERRAAEKEAEVAALKAAMEAAFQKSAPTPQAYQNYYGMNEQEETEDQRIEKKVNALLAAKEEQYRKEMEHQERTQYPTRLARDFPDFKSVCSQENLDYLDYHYPELSRPLQRLPEGYDKWSDIYHAVKKFIPNHVAARKDAMRVDVNSQKPKSISSTSITQPGQGPMETMQQTEQRRSENWLRMQRVMKGI